MRVKSKKNISKVFKVLTVFAVICSIFVSFSSQDVSKNVNAQEGGPFIATVHVIKAGAYDLNGRLISPAYNSEYYIDERVTPTTVVSLPEAPKVDGYVYMGYWYHNGFYDTAAHYYYAGWIPGGYNLFPASTPPEMLLTTEPGFYDRGNKNAVTDNIQCDPCITYGFEYTYAPALKLTYDVNGGAGSVVDAKDYYVLDNQATIKDGASLTKAGYEFTSWNTEVDGSGITYTPADVLTMTENLTLYAQWVPILTAETKYTITYDDNELTRTIIGVDEFVANENAVIRDGAGLVKTGFEFTGWNTAADGTGVAYAPNATVVVTENVTLFATWKAVEVVPVPVTVTVTPPAALPQTGNKTLIYVLELIVSITALAGIKLLVNKKSL